MKDLLSVGQDIDDPTSDEDIADTSEALGRIINVDVQDKSRDNDFSCILNSLVLLSLIIRIIVYTCHSYITHWGVWQHASCRAPIFTTAKSASVLILLHTVSV